MADLILDPVALARDDPDEFVRRCEAGGWVFRTCVLYKKTSDGPCGCLVGALYFLAVGEEGISDINGNFTESPERGIARKIGGGYFNLIVIENGFDGNIEDTDRSVPEENRIDWAIGRNVAVAAKILPPECKVPLP